MLKLFGSFLIICGLVVGTKWNSGHQYLARQNVLPSKDEPFQLDQDSVDPDGPCMNEKKCENGGYCYGNATVPTHCNCPLGYSGQRIV